MNKRQQEMLTFIDLHVDVSIHELIEEFQMSEPTIRNDLRTLQKENLITRTHGGALSINKNYEKSYDTRETINNSLKTLVGKSAVQFISENDVIYLDAGSSVFSMIEFLLRDFHLTVITSALHIANALTNFDNIEVHITGGLLNKRLNELYGPKTIDEINKIKVHKAFISISSFDPQIGIFENHILSSETKKAILDRSFENYVLADSTKEDGFGLTKISNWDKIHTFIVDSGITKRSIDLIKNHSVKFVLAE